MKVTESGWFLLTLVVVAVVFSSDPPVAADPLVLVDSPIVPEAVAEIVPEVAAEISPVTPSRSVVIEKSVSVPEGMRMLNEQRRQRGLGPLRLDAELQSAAESKASTAASRRHTGHLGGSLYGASHEGVGYGSTRVFRACYSYTAPANTPAGAAIRIGADGRYYCCLLIRSSRNLSSSNTGRSRVFLSFRRR